jgi:hypothetical protein
MGTLQVDPSQVEAIHVDPSQVQAMSKTAYAPAQPQTVGNLFHSAAQSGLGMLKSLWDMSPPAMAVDALKNAGRVLSGQQPDTPAVQKMAMDLLQSHYDQAKQALEAAKSGNYTEAFGHALAAVTPMVGPVAAHIATRFGGTPPTMDKYGNVVTQGELPDPMGAVGEAIPQVAAAALPAAVKGLRTAPEAAATDVAPVAADAVGAAPAPSGGLFRSTLNPVQQAAVDYLRSQDVPLNAGTVTGNKFLKGAQALVQNQPLGARVAAEASRATEAGLTRVAGELANQAHPTPVTPASAGQAVSDALGKQIENLKLREDEAYGEAWQGADDPANAVEVPVKTVQRPIYDATGRETGQTESAPVMAKVQMPVDVRGIKQQLGPVYESMQWMPASDQASSAGFQAVKKILSGPDFIPAQAAEQGLGGLKTMARTPNANLRNTAQGMAAGIIPDLQDGIDAAVAKVDPQNLKGLQDGRAYHATKMEIADLADQLREEPVKTFDKLTWRQDTGISFLQRIHDTAPEVLPQVGRAFVQKLFDQATQEGGFGSAQGLLKQWENLGPQTKPLLYPNPGLRSALDNFFLGAKIVAENPNPSGTAVVAQLVPGGMLMISNPVVGTSYLLGGYAAAKLLFSPRGVSLLTGGLRPAASVGAAGMAASQIMKIAGPDDITPIPPGGGGPKTPPETPGGGSAAGGNPSPVPPGGGLSGAVVGK